MSDTYTVRPNRDQLDKIKARIARAYAMFGANTVLIPILYKTKKAATKWRGIELKDTQSDEYIALFGNDNGFAIKLGRCSNGLCSIDLDNDEILTDFRRLNPWSAKALTTKAARGANIWVRIIGDYEPYMAFEGLGEWRCDGFYTLIAGCHPTGVQYLRVGDATLPYEIAFEGIVWPQKMAEQLEERRRQQPPTPSHSSELTVSDKLETEKLESGKLGTAYLNADGSIELHPDEATHLGSVGTTPLQSSTPTALPPTECAPVVPAPFASGKPRTSAPKRPVGPVAFAPSSPTVCATGEGTKLSVEDAVANLKLLSEVESRYADWKKNNEELKPIYEKQIERYHEAEVSGRNAMIVKSVPRLYHAFQEDVIVTLVMAFYDINQPYFSDPREQHEYEARKMIELVAETYLKELPPEDRSVYDCLPKEWKAAFRICRDLAKTGNPEFGPCHFFMSGDQLKARLGLKNSSQAARILKKLKKAGLIQAVGTEKRGVREATTYVWRLPILEQPKAA